MRSRRSHTPSSAGSVAGLSFGFCFVSVLCFFLVCIFLRSRPRSASPDCSRALPLSLIRSHILLNASVRGGLSLPEGLQFFRTPTHSDVIPSFPLNAGVRKTLGCVPLAVQSPAPPLCHNLSRGRSDPAQIYVINRCHRSGLLAKRGYHCSPDFPQSNKSLRTCGLLMLLFT